MGNERFAMAAKKICKAWSPYKMTIKINQVIPYKMKDPNPAKFSNCMPRFLYDSDSILKSSRIWQGAGNKMASEMGLEALQISTCYKMEGLFPTKWPRELGFLRASRPPIS